MKCLIFILSFALYSVISKGQTVREISIEGLQQLIKDRDKPLLVNFWATWCAPCIEEMPYFDSLARTKKVQLIFVSLDAPKAFPEAIEKFVKKEKYYASVYWLNESDADYFCPKIDSSWSGAIPASLFIDPAKKIRRFTEQQLSRIELIEFIKN